MRDLVVNKNDDGSKHSHWVPIYNKTKINTVDTVIGYPCRTEPNNYKDRQLLSLVASQQPFKYPTANEQNAAWGLIADTLMLEKDGNVPLFSVTLKARAVRSRFLQFIMMAKKDKDTALFQSGMDNEEYCDNFKQVEDLDTGQQSNYIIVDICKW
jgi:hypothetical protein